MRRRVSVLNPKKDPNELMVGRIPTWDELQPQTVDTEGFATKLGFFCEAEGLLLMAVNNGPPGWHWTAIENERHPREIRAEGWSKSADEAQAVLVGELKRWLLTEIVNCVREACRKPYREDPDPKNDPDWVIPDYCSSQCRQADREETWREIQKIMREAGRPGW